MDNYVKESYIYKLLWIAKKMVAGHKPDMPALSILFLHSDKYNSN